MKDTEQFHTYKFDMIGYMNNFLNNKNYQISIQSGQKLQTDHFYKIILTVAHTFIQGGPEELIPWDHWKTAIYFIKVLLPLPQHQ